MTELIAELFNGVPKELAVVLMSALPVSELRGAIPTGIELWNLSIGKVYLLAVLGNLLPFLPLFFGLELLRSMFGRVFPKGLVLLDKYIEKSKRRLEGKYATYGSFALFLFTAIPLPLTGLYTATTAAVALKLPLKSTFFAVFTGVLTAATVMTLLTVGISALT